MLRLLVIAFITLSIPVFSGCDPQDPDIENEKPSGSADGATTGDTDGTSTTDAGTADGNAEGTSTSDAGSSDGNTEGTSTSDAGTADGNAEGTSTSDAGTADGNAEGTSTSDAGTADGNAEGTSTSDAGTADGSAEGTSTSDAGSSDGSNDGTTTDAGTADGNTDGNSNTDAGSGDGSIDGTTTDAGPECTACAAGYILDASDCSCVDVNECIVNMQYCDANALCENTDGSYTCSCNTGYSGTGLYSDEGPTCNDTDECITANPCSSDATCTNSNIAGEAPTCACPDGYEGDGTSTGTGCEDIDECVTDNPCSSDATCTNSNIAGEAPTCACPDGYEGDGTSTGTGCNDTDECATNNPCSSDATCTNSNIAGEAPTCACPDGYEGDGTSAGTGCNDTDECATDNPCSSDATCTNSNIAGEAPTCACPDGYEGDGTSTGTGCNDTDECTTNNPCSSDATCTNSNIAGEAPTCACPDGYEGDGTSAGTGCEDIDECVTDNPCSSDATCTNSNIAGEAPTCACPDGYEGDGTSTGTGCEDIDECVTDNPCSSDATCTNSNIAGEAPTCACPDGYEGDGTSTGTGCEDIDECVTDNPCSSDATCTNSNIAGEAPTCACPDGYEGDGTSTGTGCEETTYNVAFSVDMNCVDNYTAEDGDLVYIGANLDSNNTFFLSDSDDDGIWTGSFEISSLATYVKVSIQRGEDDAFLYEDFEDSACTEEYVVDFFGSFGFWRPLTLTADTSLAYTFNQCDECANADVYGCMDENANNYDSDANVESICIYDVSLSVDMSCSGYAYEEDDNVFFATPEGDAIPLNQDTANSQMWSASFELRDDRTHYKIAVDRPSDTGSTYYMFEDFDAECTEGLIFGNDDTTPLYYRPIDVTGDTTISVTYGQCSVCASTTVDLTGYQINLYQNGSTANELKFSHTLNGTYEIGSYIAIARNADDLAQWQTFFDPVLSTAEVENIALFLDTNESWAVNGPDDPVEVLDPTNNIVDAANPDTDNITIRDSTGNWISGVSTEGAQGAHASIPVVDGPLYIYEIGEKSSSTRLADYKGNYVLIYVSGN